MSITESAANEVIDVYERRGADWVADRLRSGFAELKWLNRFEQLIDPAAAVLDIGCGAGVPIARYLIDRGFAVTGIDGSQKMIDRCRARFPDRSWHVADMRTLSLEQRFQGIVAWDSFFHLTRDAQRRMFPIFKQHTLPRAALLFTSGPSNGEAIGNLYGEALYHASLSSEEYRSLLADNGFEARAHVVEDPDCGGRTVWLAQRISQ